ncbi:hypothetical protein Y032_0003g1347 [Ancylostoma ceylanicum]|uniref:Uncharacterized protein n=1 Tax=Ancylostoma ceylanicum TaxID=53326 RepID=A0A016VZ19_9BILA|nr:hypothetical protein Y032_0003g1347 [Ancylostoma ceylanicum]
MWFRSKPPKTLFSIPNSCGEGGRSIGAEPKFLLINPPPRAHFLKITLLIERVPHPLPRRMETAFHVLPAMEYRPRPYTCTFSEKFRIFE